ncbi:MAG: adenosine-specific kinase [Actinobacteria bacterium]|nr:adenosine-specific kinase [Actinomycetota bacterium]
MRLWQVVRTLWSDRGDRGSLHGPAGWRGVPEAPACDDERVTETTLSWDVVAIDKPDDVNVIVGQAHFIKTVDDLHEALVGVSPSLRFGVAFCEASGVRLVRRSGNDPDLVELATRNASAIGAGHTFVILLRDGFPVNVLNPVKAVPEVCTIFCATANPVDILVAVTPRGRGVAGVVDGEPPLGVETEGDVADRRALLRTIGYKL